MRATAACAAAPRAAAAVDVRGGTRRALSATAVTFRGSSASKWGETLSSGRSGTTRRTSGWLRSTSTASRFPCTSRSLPRTVTIRGPDAASSRAPVSVEASWPACSVATKSCSCSSGSAVSCSNSRRRNDASSAKWLEARVLKFEVKSVSA
eukprot:2009389-Prymnesium_polylepis.1